MPAAKQNRNRHWTPPATRLCLYCGKATTQVECHSVCAVVASKIRSFVQSPGGLQFIADELRAEGHNLVKER